MKIHSYNEWDQIREIVVGRADNANWPTDDPVFALEAEKTSWKETPVPSGPVPQWIIDEANEDLNGLAKILETAGAVVHRPADIDFVATKGMYNYCPRDRLFIAGDTIVDPPMMYPCRDQEITALDFVTEGNTVLSMPRDQGLVLDAANMLRLGKDKYLFLESASGNKQAWLWLMANLPTTTSCELVNFYAGVHIDSTIVPLREGLVLLNGARVTPSTLPNAFRDWECVYVQDVIAQDFYQYPYASKWIALNMLSINANTVICDRNQHALMRTLESHGIDVVPHELRHSRTLGGGFHCVTLDTWREND